MLVKCSRGNFFGFWIRQEFHNRVQNRIVGVGLGGTFELCAYLAKKALLRPIDKRNPKKHIAKLERELVSAINALKIGPMGLGGKTTVLGVNIIDAPTHIAGLPVAVNVSCHATRSAEAII